MRLHPVVWLFLVVAVGGGAYETYDHYVIRQREIAQAYQRLEEQVVQAIRIVSDWSATGGKLGGELENLRRDIDSFGQKIHAALLEAKQALEKLKDIRDQQDSLKRRLLNFEEQSSAKLKACDAQISRINEQIVALGKKAPRNIVQELERLKSEMKNLEAIMVLNRDIQIQSAALLAKIPRVEDRVQEQIERIGIVEKGHAEITQENEISANRVKDLMQRLQQIQRKLEGQRELVVRSAQEYK